MKKFNDDELKEFDGSEPDKAIYVAYKGKVYDVTESPLFIEGMHFEHYAGADLTEFMDEAPHEEDVMEEFKVVGEYEEG